MQRRLTAAAILALAVAITAVGAGAEPPSSYLDLTVKGRASANPSIAAERSLVAVAWAAADAAGITDIYTAVSRDAGRTFAAPARVNAVPGSASVSGEQPPRVVLVARAGREPAITVMWTAKAPAGTQLLSARSDDGGRSFGGSEPLAGAIAGGNRGWHSTAADSTGSVFAVWLDHRELASANTAPGVKAPPVPGGEHQHAGHDMGQSARPNQSELSKLYFARLGDPASARALLGGVCYCCKTALVAGGGGSIYAAWRHVYPGNIRDIAFTMSRDGGRTFAPPVRVSDDKWVLDGCPENGPALAVDAQNRIHVAWPTLVPGPTPQSEPTLALFYAMSRDGRTFTPRQRIATQGLPRHVQIAVDAASRITLIWDEQGGGTRVVRGRGTVSPTGAVTFTREPVADAAPGIYPVIASLADGQIAAWTSGTTGATAIRVARLSH
jgi:hypothetical protein